jgi:hypothetical protein
MTIHFLDMMRFQRNAVFTALHGSPPQWNENLHLKTIHKTEDESFDANSDNTALVAVLLSIKHNSSAQNVHAIMRPQDGSSNSRRAFNQLKFCNSNIHYDRILTFGDLNTPRKCFVIIMKNITESDFLLTHMRQSCTVGDIIVLIKHEAPMKALNDMPVISTIMPVVPLALLNNIPPIPLVTPQPGQQHYFLLKGIPIRMSHATMVPESPGINQPIHISYLYPGSRTAITQIEQMRFIPSYIAKGQRIR